MVSIWRPTRDISRLQLVAMVGKFGVKVTLGQQVLLCPKRWAKPLVSQCYGAIIVYSLSERLKIDAFASDLKLANNKPVEQSVAWHGYVGNLCAVVVDTYVTKVLSIW